MGKLTISMAMFNSKLLNYQRVCAPYFPGFQLVGSQDIFLDESDCRITTNRPWYSNPDFRSEILLDRSFKIDKSQKKNGY